MYDNIYRFVWIKITCNDPIKDGAKIYTADT